MKKIVFLTGTRADYGKIKSLLKTIEASHLFELHVFVTGMHMSKRHGETWREVIRDGYEHIHLRTLASNPHFRLFPSIRFEYFLSLMKMADFVIGNSSAGVRESCVYGIPSIDIGDRQAGRYQTDLIKNIQHCSFDEDEILRAIEKAPTCRIQSSQFGDGCSSSHMLALLKNPEFWCSSLQKQLCYD